MISWATPLIPICLIMLDTVTQLAVLLAALMHIFTGRVPFWVAFTNFGAALKLAASNFSTKLVSDNGKELGRPSLTSIPQARALEALSSHLT